ncbi:MAG: hypothetical protein IPM29_20250 [Planctomycetes bacterium]|nr:hypothetical protein [Planctomycetota bacterium]
MTRPRIRRLAVAFGVGALLLTVHLHRLMVADRDVWLERSYLNRWAFRDVPTRRGSLFDRDGALIAEDRPGFDLELRYATFRRRHPIACVLHAANLAHAALGDAAPRRYDTDTDYAAALDELLALPLVWLGRDGSAWRSAAGLLRYRDDPGDVGRDLRFYTGAAVAGLLGLRHRDVAADLAKATRADAAAGLRVLDAIGPRAARQLGLDPGDHGGVRTALRAALGRRVAELRELNERLLAIGIERDPATDPASAPSLWDELERRRLDSEAWRDFQELPDADRDALGDHDFWRWLARERGAPLADLDEPGEWLALAPELRAELLVAWGARRDALRTALTAAERAAHRALDRVETRLAQPDLAVSYASVEAERRAAERAWWELRRRLDRGELLAADAGERLPTYQDEARARALRRQLPYPLAAWLGELRERLPGLDVRPTALRTHGTLPGRADLGSFGAYVGRVTPYFASDFDAGAGAATPSREAEDVLESVERAGVLDLADDSLPDDLEESLRRGAERTLRGHFSVYGRVGRSGVELDLDDLLSGTPGLRFIERDRQAREERMFAWFDVRRGRDVTLTVDLRLQALADRVVADLSGAREQALVALDAQTGDVLALAGCSQDEEAARGQQLSAAATWVLGNPAVGSVVKPFVALAYLEQLAADPDLPGPETFQPCQRSYGMPSGSRRFTCSHAHGADSQSVVAAVAHSCNIFFYEVHRVAGLGPLHTALRRIGWDADPDDPDDALQEHVPGLPGNRLMRSRLNPAGLSGYVQSIGYGVDVPALMVARAYAALATGELPDVGLVADPARRRRPLGFDRGHLQLVRAGLHECITDAGGTGVSLLGPLQRMGLADVAHGKSGTARVVTRSGETATNAWFALFLGTDADAGLVIVATAYGLTDGSGGRDAGAMVVDFLTAIHDSAPLRERYLGGSSR